MSERYPNILFLMSDEHRADIAGFAGNEIVRTPTLDWLAETGVVFENAYTPSPICVPARQAMASGKYCHSCGCYRYGEDLPPFSMTFAKRFSQYAYSTIACGKLHHQGPEQMQGWLTRVGADITCGERYDDIAPEARKLYPKPQQKWSDTKEILRAGVGSGPHTQDLDRYALAGAKMVIDHHFCDPYFDRSKPGYPLFLKVSFNRPHYPYLTDEERFKYYMNRVPVYSETETFDHPFLSQREVVPGRDVSELDLRRATTAYYGMVDEIDNDYGSVLEKLRAIGEDLDDWIIVYTADHGEMLGEHGIWEKQKFFEASVRIPLIIRWPKGFEGGRRVRENVNTIDLFATLCDLAGIPAPDDLDSRSLVPLLKGDSSAWDNETMSHF
ncbi:MAG: sulfatase-like hydrolase/transferase, partial [Planctomycetes bacterium]|nr:sulfatase-like hydrolase/transferase [Planctomycetota bacterium]